MTFAIIIGWSAWAILLFIGLGAGVLCTRNPLRNALAHLYWRWQWKTGRIRFSMQNWRKDL